MAGERPKPILAGILLGGASSRMGRAKGLLPAPDGAPTLVARWVRLFESMTLPCVLVGERSEYAPLGLPLLADADALLPLARARLSRGELSVAGLLDEASALALHLTEPELHALRDWDTPHDIARDGDAGGTAAPPRR